VANDHNATPARFAVGAAVGVAGIAGFFTQQRGHPIDANIRANAPQREAWQRRVDAVKAENATRRSAVRMVVRATPQNVADRGGR
jgi:hypothetical protein